ncbi:hypothetical protein [Allokutzneria multivorans]|uniref:hypothetical protein n=1 Tax=Allokutzneria multivorans TaxID=1142134 RepID=UPI0031EEEC5B
MRMTRAERVVPVGRGDHEASPGRQVQPQAVRPHWHRPGHRTERSGERAQRPRRRILHGYDRQACTRRLLGDLPVDRDAAVAVDRDRQA